MFTKRSTRTVPEKDEFTNVYKFFSEWTPVRDVFALKYFAASLSVLCGGTAAYINFKFRRAMKLRGQGLFSSFLPIVVIPSIISTLSHFTMVMKPILMRERECSICLEVRSGGLLLGSGLVLPSLLAPIGAFMSATRYCTYPIPSLVEQPKETVKLAARTFKPILPKLTLLSIFLFTAGMLLAYSEESNFQTVMQKVHIMETLIQERKAQKNLKETEL